MAKNTEVHVSHETARLIDLLDKSGRDVKAMLAAHPEITAGELAEAFEELLTIIEELMLDSSEGPPPSSCPPGTAYQLKITLRDSKPAIWRRVVVPADLTLDQLHDVIQAAMGWHDSHLHNFEIGEEYYGPQPEDPSADEHDESQYRLCDLLSREKMKCVYTYDLGDNWEHAVLVEKIVPARQKPQTMLCLKGAGACPPEDCGGIYGYYELLDALNDPKHPEHDSMLEWVGGEPLDPAAFDLAAVNRRLQQLAKG